MYISLAWLSQYVDIPGGLSPQELASKITLHTAEVESVEDMREKFAHIVIGEVLKIYPHPSADKLQLADINIGTGNPMTIVCGDPKIYEGMKAAFAGEGARVRWHGEGDLVTMKRTKIRGVESSGMICAGVELGIEAFFPEQSPLSVSDFKQFDCKPGDAVAEVLGLTDVILEVDNKSLTNRPDLFGHYGFARELATIFRTQLRPYITEAVEIPEEPALNIEIKDSGKIRRMTCLQMDNITIAESPLWLKEALSRVGIRSINNIVDISNFVMCDLGQPLHAFDTAKLAGETLIWSHPEENTEVVTLDGTKRTITPEMLLIYDAEKPVSLGLIMGLENSEVDNRTTSIILEASSCDPTIIRKTAAALGLRTDASTRTEKNLNPEMTALALRKAAQLILTVCPDATISSAMTDAYPLPTPEITIQCTHEFLETRLGFEVSNAYIETTLSNLEFIVERNENTYTITVPSHRSTKDVSIAEDIVEELARIHGYDNIPNSTPEFPISLLEKKPELQLEKQIQHLLAKDLRMQEVYNYSFVSEKNQVESLVGMDNIIEIANPISEEQRYLRTSLVPNILVNIRENLKFFDRFDLFEIGHIYEKNEDSIWNKHTDLPFERKQIISVHVEPRREEKEMADPYYSTKGTLEALLRKLHLPTPTFTSADNSSLFNDKWAHPGTLAQVIIDQKPIALLAQIHPWVAKNFELEQSSVIICVIDFEALQKVYHATFVYQPISKFPGSNKAFSFVLPESTTYGALENAVKEASPLVHRITLQDIFRDDQKIGAHHKSMSIDVELHAGDRTLTDEDIQTSMRVIIAQAEKMGAKIRS